MTITNNSHPMAYRLYWMHDFPYGVRYTMRMGQYTATFWVAFDATASLENAVLWHHAPPPPWAWLAMRALRCALDRLGGLPPLPSDCGPSEDF